jgi:hypothetical protein
MLMKSLSTSVRYAALYGAAGGLAEFCQALFPLLVVHADDYGRLPGDVFTVKHVVVPASPRSETELGLALMHLQHVQLINWYQAGGRKWIQIEQFDDHQPGLSKRTESKIPPPSREIHGNPGNSRSRARAELNRTELNRTKERKNAASPPSPRPRKEKPKIQTLTALVREEVLPMRLPSESDRMETAKRLAAQRHLAYDSPSIAKALDAATAQVAKRVRYES